MCSKPVGKLPKFPKDSLIWHSHPNLWMKSFRFWTNLKTKQYPKVSYNWRDRGVRAKISSWCCNHAGRDYGDTLYFKSGILLPKLLQFQPEKRRTIRKNVFFFVQFTNFAFLPLGSELEPLWWSYRYKMFSYVGRDGDSTTYLKFNIVGLKVSS